MTIPAHVFVETNFLFGIFRMPSKQQPDALTLKTHFDAGQVKLYVPYICFQEARHLIAKSLPSNRCADLFEFHQFVSKTEAASWDFREIRKLLDAATGEVSRTKAVYQRELAEFSTALSDGILHGTKEVFDLVESIELDDDNLEYNDKLILASVLVKARELRRSKADARLYFASVDKSDLAPTENRPRMKRCYDEIGLVFVPNFSLPDVPEAPAK